jgi:hypothetical protein
VFVRVKDKSSGHEFDVPETDWRIEAGHFTPVKTDRYPASPVARLPKYNVSPPRAKNPDKES